MSSGETTTDRFQKELYTLSLERYGLQEKEKRLHLPEPVRPWFLGEESVDIPDPAGSGFFWQRLSQFVGATEPSYYRFEIEPARLPTNLRAIAPKGTLLLLWLRVQFEAHQLLEHSITLAVGDEEALRVSPDFLYKEQEHLTEAKIYFTPLELERRITFAKASLGTELADEIETIQRTMAHTLAEEMGRIREYYGHLLAKTTKHDEKERLRHEQKRLETEHIRRLHPAALKIIASPELIVSLKF